MSTALQQGLDEHQRRVVVLHQQHVQLVLARGVGERRDGRRVVCLRIGIGRARGGCHGGRSRDRARRHRLRTVTSVPPRERRLTRAVARDASARFRPGRAVRSKRRRDGRCRAKAVIRALARVATHAPTPSHAPRLCLDTVRESMRECCLPSRGPYRVERREVWRGRAHSLPQLPGGAERGGHGLTRKFLPKIFSTVAASTCFASGKAGA